MYTTLTTAYHIAPYPVYTIPYPHYTLSTPYHVYIIAHPHCARSTQNSVYTIPDSHCAQSTLFSDYTSDSHGGAYALLVGPWKTQMGRCVDVGCLNIKKEINRVIGKKGVGAGKKGLEILVTLHSVSTIARLHYSPSTLYSVYAILRLHYAPSTRYPVYTILCPYYALSTLYPVCTIARLHYTPCVLCIAQIWTCFRTNERHP